MYRKPQFINCEKEEYHKATVEGASNFFVNHTPFYSPLKTESIVTLKNYTDGTVLSVASITQSTGFVSFAGQSINDELLITYKWGTGYTFAFNPNEISFEKNERFNAYEIIDGSKTYDGITVKTNITLTGENMDSEMQQNIENAKQSMRLQFYTHEDGRTYIIKIATFGYNKKRGTGRDEYVYDYDIALEEV